MVTVDAIRHQGRQSKFAFALIRSAREVCDMDCDRMKMGWHGGGTGFVVFGETATKQPTSVDLFGQGSAPLIS